jgi:anti-sigma factor (TIGR02949 family)
MMTCRELVEHLIDFLDGEMPEERRQHVQQHLDLCGPCLAYLETYQVTIRLTRRLPDVPPPPELLQRLKAALATECTQGGIEAKEQGESR